MVSLLTQQKSEVSLEAVTFSREIVFLNSLGFGYIQTCGHNVNRKPVAISLKRHCKNGLEVIYPGWEEQCEDTNHQASFPFASTSLLSINSVRFIV